MASHDELSRLNETLRFFKFSHNRGADQKAVTVRFDLEMGSGEHCVRSVRVCPQGATVYEGDPNDSKIDARVAMPFDIFLQVYSGDVHPIPLIMKGQISVNSWGIRSLKLFANSFDFRSEMWDQFYEHEKRQKLQQPSTQGNSNSKSGRFSEAIMPQPHHVPNQPQIPSNSSNFGNTESIHQRLEKHENSESLVFYRGKKQFPFINLLSNASYRQPHFTRHLLAMPVFLLHNPHPPAYPFSAQKIHYENAKNASDETITCDLPFRDDLSLVFDQGLRDSEATKSHDRFSPGLQFSNGYKKMLTLFSRTSLATLAPKQSFDLWDAAILASEY